MDDSVRFDELCHSYLMHFGVPGHKKHQHDPNRRWQSHAVYAQGRPNPDAKVRGQKDATGTKNSTDLSASSDNGSFKNLKKLSGPPNFETRYSINHPSNGGYDGDRRNNCPNCSAAFDMQERGYDVIAKPASKDVKQSDLESLYTGGKLRQVSDNMDRESARKLGELYKTAMNDYGSKAAKAWNKYYEGLTAHQMNTARNTEQEIRSQGKNARGVIVVGWLDSPSLKRRSSSYHAFNYKNNNGIVSFYDMQSSDRDMLEGMSMSRAARDFFLEVDPRDVFLMRTDNLEPSEAIMSAVYSPDRSLNHSYPTSQEILGKFKMMMGAKQ